MWNQTKLTSDVSKSGDLRRCGGCESHPLNPDSRWSIHCLGSKKAVHENVQKGVKYISEATNSSYQCLTKKKKNNF